MKKIVLLFFLSILNIDAYCQSALEKFFGVEYHKGFVVLNNGDTIKSTIIFNNSWGNYYNVRLIDSNKNITSYGPKDVLVFSFDSLYFYPKKFNVTKKRSKDAFMCLLSDDQLKVYLHRYHFNNGVVDGSGTAYILEKSDNESVQIIYNRMFNLKKHAGYFFKDCSHISEKINNKTYKVGDILRIAHEYNEWLKQNTQ